MSAVRVRQCMWRAGAWLGRRVPRVGAGRRVSAGRTLEYQGNGMGVVVLRLLRLFPNTLAFLLSSLCTVPYHRGYPDIGKGREWRIG